MIGMVVGAQTSRAVQIWANIPSISVLEQCHGSRHRVVVGGHQLTHINLPNGRIKLLGMAWDAPQHILLKSVERRCSLSSCALRHKVWAPDPHVSSRPLLENKSPTLGNNSTSQRYVPFQKHSLTLERQGGAGIELVQVSDACWRARSVGCADMRNMQVVGISAYNRLRILCVCVCVASTVAMM
eukprot:48056-Eustigmatos_ZCMA.PRE.2